MVKKFAVILKVVIKRVHYVNFLLCLSLLLTLVSVARKQMVKMSLSSNFLLGLEVLMMWIAR